MPNAACLSEDVVRNAKIDEEAWNAALDSEEGNFDPNDEPDAKNVLFVLDSELGPVPEFPKFDRATNAPLDSVAMVDLVVDFDSNGEETALLNAPKGAPVPNAESPKELLETPNSVLLPNSGLPRERQKTLDLVDEVLFSESRRPDELSMPTVLEDEVLEPNRKTPLDSFSIETSVESFFFFFFSVVDTAVLDIVTSLGLTPTRFLELAAVVWPNSGLDSGVGTALIAVGISRDSCGLGDCCDGVIKG